MTERGAAVLSSLRALKSGVAKQGAAAASLVIHKFCDSKIVFLNIP